ncbi:MAG: transposase [Thermodesulfovibrionales bacterium]|nr:transposase [Thermodesulfovibrionales bacterium]
MVRILKDLYRIGLIGEARGLVITDGNLGLENVAVYPFLKKKWCWVHKLRNVANYLKKKYLKESIKEARAIFSSRKDAQQVYNKGENRLP